MQCLFLMHTMNILVALQFISLLSTASGYFTHLHTTVYTGDTCTTVDAASMWSFDVPIATTCTSFNLPGTGTRYYKQVDCAPDADQSIDWYSDPECTMLDPHPIKTITVNNACVYSSGSEVYYSVYCSTCVERLPLGETCPGQPPFTYLHSTSYTDNTCTVIEENASGSGSYPIPTWGECLLTTEIGGLQLYYNYIDCATTAVTSIPKFYSDSDCTVVFPAGNIPQVTNVCEESGGNHFSRYCSSCAEDTPVGLSLIHI